jgi:hypothetical protein
MKEGDGVPGQRPFNGHGGEQRKGAGRWKAATRQEGAERERERERGRGGVSPRPTGGARPLVARGRRARAAWRDHAAQSVQIGGGVGG